jgi:hypothetical protein
MHLSSEKCLSLTMQRSVRVTCIAYTSKYLELRLILAVGSSHGAVFLWRAPRHLGDRERTRGSI